MSHYHCQYHIGIVVMGIIQCFMNMQGGGGAYVGGTWVPMTLLGSGKNAANQLYHEKALALFSSVIYCHT